MENRRKRYVINPLQWRMAIWALMLFGAGVLAIWAEVKGDLSLLQTSIVRDFNDPQLATYIDSYSKLITQGIVLKSLVVMALIWAMVMFISHHLLGPIYRLKMCLKELQQGNYTCRMRLRKRDFLKDMADSFNDLAAKLEERHKKS